MSKSHEEIMEIKADVQARYPKHEFPDVALEPVYYGRREHTKIDNRWAIVNQNNGDCFNICSELYKPISYEETIWDVEQAVKLHPEFGVPEISPHLLSNGGKLRVNVEFPEVKFDIKKDSRQVGDLISPMLDVFSSLDLSWKYNPLFGAKRLVCLNGATTGMIFDSFKKRHLTSLDPTLLGDTIASGMEKYSEQADLWTKWANTNMITSEYEGIWEALPFSKPEREKIEQLPETATRLLLPDALKHNDLSMWDFFNVLTQFATHEIKSELRQVEILPQITKVFEKHYRA